MKKLRQNLKFLSIVFFLLSLVIGCDVQVNAPTMSSQNVGSTPDQNETEIAEIIPTEQPTEDETTDSPTGDTPTPPPTVVVDTATPTKLVDPTATPTLNPDSNLKLWSRKADMPTGRMYLSTSVIDGKIYAIGGLGGENVVEMYDPVTDTWTRKADMPTGRAYLSTSVVDGKIYAIGGNPATWRKTLATVEEYDPATDTWTKKADMPFPRDWLSTCVVGGKIYAIGGSEVDEDTFYHRAQKSVQEYDPSTDTWTVKTDMQKSRRSFDCVVLDEKIYTVGGYVSFEEMYDPETDTWMEKEPMPVLRTGSTANTVNGKIYVFGGDEDDYYGPPTFVVYVYDPESDGWTILDPMPYGQLLASSSVVDGKIYIIGGTNNAYPHRAPYLTSNWEYTPQPQRGFDRKKREIRI